MERHEVPPQRWPKALERFSRLHAGRPVHVSTAGSAVSGASNAGDLPLIGVTTGAPGATAREELRIMVGQPGGPHVDHLVTRPRRLWTADWNDGCSGMLEIVSDDGSMTLVQVGPPEQVLPQGIIVDGVPPER